MQWRHLATIFVQRRREKFSRGSCPCTMLDRTTCIPGFTLCNRWLLNADRAVLLRMSHWSPPSAWKHVNDHADSASPSGARRCNCATLTFNRRQKPHASWKPPSCGFTRNAARSPSRTSEIGFQRTGKIYFHCV